MDYFSIYLKVVAILVILVILFSIANLIVDHIPGRHTKIIGVRDYKIVLKYADISLYGFTDPQQVEKFKYFVKIIVDHITLNGLTRLYGTKYDLQSLVDDFYENICVAYENYNYKRHLKCSEEEYRATVAFLEKENAKIIEKLRKFNREIVDYINYIYDSDGDDYVKNDYREAQYDLTGVCLWNKEESGAE